MTCKKRKRSQAPPTDGDEQTVGDAIEECMDEINDFIETLQHYPPKVVSIALGVHLQSILSAMVECDLCTREEAKKFIRELEDTLDGN